ncbi:MAG TPA: hypothetical protein DDW71_04535, partial [Lactobacillus sp.]|nr:hypothetical protein [Lactobacillus sp.]
RTITYTGVANGQNPAAKVQPITWTTDTDEVTGVTTYTPSGNYDAVPTPSVTGYKADTESVPAVTNKATTIKPENVTAAVTYTADKAGLTVTYEDVDEANKVVDTDTVTGTTDETGTYTAVAPKVMNLRRRISQHQSTTRLQRTIRITSLSQSSISTHQHYQRALPVPQPGQSPTPV